MKKNVELTKLWLWLVLPTLIFSDNINAQAWPNIDLNLDKKINNDPNTIQSENSVFISPINKNIILNANNSNVWDPIGGKQNGALGVSNFSSNDGGLNWSGNIQLNVPLNGTGDPSVVIGNTGRFFINYINSNGDQDVSYSDNNGVNWTTVNIALNPGNISIGNVADKNHLWIDNSSASAYSGNLYCGWTPIYTGVNNGQIVTKHSVDNGQTWVPANGQVISTGSNLNPLATTFHTGVNIQTGRNGEVYACWAILDGGGGTQETAIGFNQSNNGGNSWLTPKRIQTISNGEHSLPLGGLTKTMRINSFPSMTVSKQTGEIFIVWSEFAVPNVDADIYMIKSSDQGLNWSSKIRVNQDPLGTDQWFPWIACDEISGALVVAYYDSRNSFNNDVETFISISYDNGTSWEDYVVGGTYWNGSKIPGFAFPATKATYAGDYISVDVYHGLVVPVWSDSRAGIGYMQANTHPFELPCTNNLSLCNVVIEGSIPMPGEAVYSVNNSIIVGGVNCNYSIKNTGDVTMQAGIEIQLKEGFSSQGEFHGKIAACSSFSQRLSGNPNSQTSENLLLTNKLEGNSNQFGFSIYPNPNNGSFKLTLNYKKEFPNSISVEDLVGKIIINIDNINSYNFDLNLSNTSNGMFIVKVIYPDKTIAKRIIKN